METTVRKAGDGTGTTRCVGLGRIQRGSSLLRVGMGDPEGPGERGESGAQKGEWNENMWSKVYVKYCE